MQSIKNLEVPKIEKKLEILEKFDIVRRDDYYYLKDKENKEVLDYLDRENKYTRAVLSKSEELQKTIYNEIVSRIKEDDESYPHKLGNYYYYIKSEKSKQYFSIYRKKDLNEKPELLLDINILAKAYDTFLFSSYTISDDDRYLMYSYNTTGSFAEYKLRIIDLEKNKDLGFEIDAISDFEFSKDSNIIYYSKVDKALRPSKVYSFDVKEQKESLVFEEKDEKFFAYISKSKNNEFLIISSASSSTSEEYLINLNGKSKVPESFLAREKSCEYSIDLNDSHFFIKYKDDKNFNSKVYKVQKDKYKDRNNWELIIEHSDEIKIEYIECFKDFMVVNNRINGLSQLEIIDYESNKSVKVSFPEKVYSLRATSNLVYESSKYRYNYSSLNRPNTLYDYDTKSKTSDVLKVAEIPSGFNPDDYIVEREFAKADDGTLVPIAIVYKKGMQKDSSNPALNYAYGSYGVNSETAFNSSVFSLVDRGYVYAISQIRGGGELGENWYQDGKMLKKKNTFTDFIACSKHLIDKGYTSSDKLSIMGGSAGGLLMGAVCNMEPSLFHSVISLVPFVDVVTTMLDDTLPLTTVEYEEWGNPNDEKYFKYMLSYSPYDNIEKKDYPHMLVVGGLNDSQVLFHEPAKYVAKLRDFKTDDNLVLLDMNMSSGHGGASGRYDRYKEMAMYYSFILFVLDEDNLL